VLFCLSNIAKPQRHFRRDFEKIIDKQKWIVCVAPRNFSLSSMSVNWMNKWQCL